MPVMKVNIEKVSKRGKGYSYGMIKVHIQECWLII